MKGLWLKPIGIFALSFPVFAQMEPGNQEVETIAPSQSSGEDVRFTEFEPSMTGGIDFGGGGGVSWDVASLVNWRYKIFGHVGYAMTFDGVGIAVGSELGHTGLVIRDLRNFSFETYTVLLNYWTSLQFTNLYEYRVQTNLFEIYIGPYFRVFSASHPIDLTIFAAFEVSFVQDTLTRRLVTGGRVFSLVESNILEDSFLIGLVTGLRLSVYYGFVAYNFHYNTAELKADRYPYAFNQSSIQHRLSFGVKYSGTYDIFVS